MWGWRWWFVLLKPVFTFLPKWGASNLLAHLDYKHWMTFLYMSVTMSRFLQQGCENGRNLDTLVNNKIKFSWRRVIRVAFHCLIITSNSLLTFLKIRKLEQYCKFKTANSLNRNIAVYSIDSDPKSCPPNFNATQVLETRSLAVT